jgi:dynein heavy chain
MMELKHIEDKDMLVSIWIHETYRVFRDRLINQKDRDKFNDLAHTRLASNLDMDWELKSYRDLLFGDFENPAKAYLKLSDVNTLIPRLD